MPKGKPCCTPSRDNSDFREERLCLIRSPDAGSNEGMVTVGKTIFPMGAEGLECWNADGEGPVHQVSLEDYFIDQTSVTNESFSTFVDATGYQSEAERFGWSFVFHNQIPKAHLKRLSFDRAFGVEWWAKVEGASWKKTWGTRHQHPEDHEPSGGPCLVA